MEGKGGPESGNVLALEQIESKAVESGAPLGSRICGMAGYSAQLFPQQAPGHHSPEAVHGHSSLLDLWQLSDG